MEHKIERNETMKIWVSAITHKHGTNVYAAVSRERLIHGLHGYVKEWWSREIPDMPFPRNEPEEDVVDRYFDMLEHETLEFIEETELVGSGADRK